MIDRNREGCLLTGVPFFEKRWGGEVTPSQRFIDLIWSCLKATIQTSTRSLLSDSFKEFEVQDAPS